ncbi:MAG TPA: glycosyltransferase family 2 protein [Candidatus Acidoferrum sp.]|nr:glycosyltransferase family 2 protein [Candidatus Acidoferrum sp.]
MNLSVVIITHNEEASLGRTLESVQPLVSGGKGEIIVVDSGSTDRTVEVAKSFAARVFIEEWKGYAAQKNSAIDKAIGDWVLSLDADEEVDRDLQQALGATVEGLERVAARKQANAHDLTVEDPRSEVDYPINTTLDGGFSGLWVPRKNQFLGRWLRHGGFWPDPKLRFFRRGSGRFEDRAVHEDVRLDGKTGQIRYGSLIHHSYPMLSDYIEHMNRYSSLGAEMVVAKGKVRFSVINIVARPLATFVYNYLLRLGFLDGREGLLLHLYHAAYVSWKYAKAWELSRKQP